MGRQLLGPGGSYYGMLVSTPVIAHCLLPPFEDQSILPSVWQNRGVKFSGTSCLSTASLCISRQNLRKLKGRTPQRDLGEVTETQGKGVTARPW